MIKMFEMEGRTGPEAQVVVISMAVAVGQKTKRERQRERGRERDRERERKEERERERERGQCCLTCCYGVSGVLALDQFGPLLERKEENLTPNQRGVDVIQALCIERGWSRINKMRGC